MRASVVAASAVLVALSACTPPVTVDRAAARKNYLAAKDRCIATYPNSLVAQSDCRADAANTYIRPFYRYGDLMTVAQTERRVLAEQADRHQISRKEYNREIADLEAEISREEDRRNKQIGVASATQD